MHNCKSFYYCDRIVDKINNSIGQDPNAKSIIGVLDIYGFESFKINRYLLAFSLDITEVFSPQG